MRHPLLAGTMNLFAPGAGLAALGRPWQGLAVAVLFTVGAEALIIGTWVAPAVSPQPVTWAGGFVALGAWGLAQILFLRRGRFLRTVDLPGELSLLRHMAEEALDHRNWPAARSALLLAFTLEPTDIASRVLWARLLTETGDRRRARRAWRAAARLDYHGAFTSPIQDGLQRVASGDGN